MTTSFVAALPIGYNFVPAGIFVDGDLAGTAVDGFGMKETPVTNKEWGQAVEGMGADTFVLLAHDWETGETKLRNTGSNIQTAMGGPVNEPVLKSLQGLQFDQGDVAILGGQILLKMVANPSAQYDRKEDKNEKGRIFSGERQPVVGLTWFHAKVWCLLQTIRSAGEWLYDLPTDLQFFYVASDKGAKRHGTSTGQIFDRNDYRRSLVHIDGRISEIRMTVDVDDPRYELASERPFGIDALGNVWRWTRFNVKAKTPGNYLDGPYGIRGASWKNYDFLEWQSSTRIAISPDLYDIAIGFSPVVMRNGVDKYDKDKYDGGPRS